MIICREPVARAVSVYYFWGELKKSKMKSSYSPIRTSKNVTQLESPILGSTGESTPIKISTYTYHGSELSSPNEKIALEYVNNLPYQPTQSGCSFTWSLFASDAKQAVRALRSDRIAPVLMERLDESLVAASVHMGWSIADMAVTLPRKVF